MATTKTSPNPTKKTAARKSSNSKQAAPVVDHTKGSITSSRQAAFTAPTLTGPEGTRVAEALQLRLNALIDLSLTIRHIHWNVVGPHFISVHQMLDPQYEAAGAMTDELAERIATLGASPRGLAGALVTARDWDDYALDRADSMAHLAALDLVYTGVVTDHRKTIDEVGDTDPISEDLLVGQTRQLEKFQWFVRSHLADWAGGVANAGEVDEMAAAAAAVRRIR